MSTTFINPASVYRFDSSEADTDYDSVDLSNENKNTKRKTETDMRIFSAYLISVKEMRKAEDIPPQELDPYLSMFFSVVKKHDGHEYEPASLRGMLCSFERYLRMKGYQSSITRDAAFNNTRNTLKNKQRILRENGKSLKKLVPVAGPEPLGPSTMEKLNHLYAAKELGPYSPMSVITSICFSFVINFKMRKAIDHKQLLWGDIVLKSSSVGEYLCYQPLDGKEYLRPKLKGIEDFRVWSNTNGGPNKDPILIYKLYSQKRPSQMMSPESPFYLGVSTSHPVHNQPWYKSLPMGVNKLNDLVRMIRDVTGTQKTQVYSSPDSPEEPPGNYSVSPSERSFSMQNESPEKNSGTDDDSEARHTSPKAGHETVMSVRTYSSKAGLGDDNFQTGCGDFFEYSDINGNEETLAETLAEEDEKIPNTAFDTDDNCLSIDEAKTLIRGLIEKVDKKRRAELVEWLKDMYIQIATNANHINSIDVKERTGHFQIMFDLNARDLTKGQDLELRGYLKCVGEAGGKNDIGCKSNKIPNSTSSGDAKCVSNDSPQVLTRHNTVDPQTTPAVHYTTDSDFEKPDKMEEIKAFKRSVPTFPDNDMTCKRQRVDGRHSWQEPSSGNGLDIGAHLDHAAAEIQSAKGDKPDQDDAVNTLSNGGGQEEARTNYQKPVVLPNYLETDIHPQPQVLGPPWIPPPFLQQFAFHHLSPYPDSRWMQLYKKNVESTSMESVFRQPFDTSLLRRVYANAVTSPSATNSVQAPQIVTYQNDHSLSFGEPTTSSPK